MTQIILPDIAQVCFPSKDGLSTLCNYVLRNGVPVFTKSGKYWKFPRVYRKKRKIIKIKDRGERKTATPLSEAAVLHTK